MAATGEDGFQALAAGHIGSQPDLFENFEKPGDGIDRSWAHTLPPGYPWVTYL